MRGHEIQLRADREPPNVAVDEPAVGYGVGSASVLNISWTIGYLGFWRILSFMSNEKNGFSDADQLAIRYLIHEIEWSRSAGRVLVGLIFASPFGLLVTVSQIDARASPSVFAAAVIISLTVFAAAGLGFRTYTRRIATQKRMLQRIIEDSEVSKKIDRNLHEAINAERWHPLTKILLVAALGSPFITILVFWLL